MIHPYRIIALVSMLALLTSCSASATIQLRDGQTIHGRIEGSNREHIYLERQVVVPREEIVTIQHPGNEQFLAGLLLTTLSILGVVALAAQGAYDSLPSIHPTSGSPAEALGNICSTLATVSSIGLLLGGVSLMVQGGLINSRSRSLARFEPENSPGPNESEVNGTTLLGIGFAVRF
ncbi:MAG: hypothetical protein JW797_03430 [Bradymonadales bacterium]|nr:hypothetical protein [Bradymonadales bacterium]